MFSTHFVWELTWAKEGIHSQIGKFQDEIMRTKPNGSDKTSPFAGKNSNGTYFYLPTKQNNQMRETEKKKRKKEGRKEKEKKEHLLRGHPFL